MIEFLIIALIGALILLLLLNISAYGTVYDRQKKLDKAVLNAISIINLNADAQKKANGALIDIAKDVDFLKIIVEIHSEALGVRNPMKTLDESQFPTYKAK